MGVSSGGGGHGNAANSRDRYDHERRHGESLMRGGKMDGGIREPLHGEQRGPVSSAEETAIAQVPEFYVPASMFRHWTVLRNSAQVA